MMAQLILAVLVLLFAAFVAGALYARVRSDRRVQRQVRSAAAHAPLPRQLTTRRLDFDRWGRTW